MNIETIKKILSNTDHTNLNPCATKEDIIKLCKEALQYETASVCISPSRIKDAYSYFYNPFSGDLKENKNRKHYPKICTVIGFPHGDTTTKNKMEETIEAIRLGADEIDMVVNLGWIKDGQYEKVLSEIDMIRKCCHGHILKVIVETGYLTESEFKKICEIVSQSGADYIKTSTGYGPRGASFEDITKMRAFCSPHLKIKAAGGIKTLEDAEKYFELGADRLGTSRIVKAVKELKKGE